LTKNVLRAFRIPPLVLCVTVIGLALAQVFEGTDLYFAAMMAVTLLSTGLIYNMLGGLSSLSGITFAGMALRWVVISQIAKIIFLQPANKYLERPDLTASVYALFFVCLVAGIFFYRNLHVRLPGIWEPKTSSRMMILYAIALPVGIIGEVVYNIYNVVYSSNQSTTEFNTSRSIGIALSAFLLFSLVLAVDHRIRKTHGRHSFGIAAFIPFSCLMLAGFINTQREPVIEPSLLYFVACYFRHYRFRARHYTAFVCFAAVFGFFISPIELYTRGIISGANLRDRTYLAFHTLTNANWGQIRSAEAAAPLLGADEGADYYNIPGTYVLGRLSEIRMDSNLIAACATYHYGFQSIRIDLLADIPRFIDKNKPDYGSADFLGRVSGVTGDLSTHAEPAFSMVSDSFGAFSWLGVVVIPLIVLPLTFCLYESMFDMSRPWGTVALVSCIILMPEGGVGRLVATMLIRLPIYLFLASRSVGLITSLIPIRGDSPTVTLAPPSLPPEPGAASAD
jgi:hypothetical protein